MILLLTGSGFERLKAVSLSLSPCVSTMKGGKERKPKKHKVKKKCGTDGRTSNSKSMFGKINIDERVRPGQVSFLDVDDDFDIQTDHRR